MNPYSLGVGGLGLMFSLVSVLYTSGFKNWLEVSFYLGGLMIIVTMSGHFLWLMTCLGS